jgi:hypothetical protein
MNFFARPFFACAFGAFLVCAETCRHIDSFRALPASWLSLPLHDWAAGFFLVYAGLRSQRDWVGGRPYQIAAWAFNASLLCGAVLAHLEDWGAQVPEEDWIPERLLVGLIGVLFALSLGGLVSTLALTNPPRRRGEPTQPS